MNLRKPLLFMIGGAVAKLSGIIIYRLWHPHVLFRVLAAYDPLGFQFAEWTVRLFFDQRRVFPTPTEALVFDLLLVVGFAVQCLILGTAISGVRFLVRCRVRSASIQSRS